MIGTNANLSVSRFGVVAMLAVQLPATASVGDSYTLSVLQPSGTSDGVSSPVALAPLAAQTITVQSISYIVGDTASAAWYNAGDFGNGDLDNSDVNNVFFASLGVRLPYNFTDAFDAMDAYPEDTAGTVGGDHQIRFLDWQVILLRSLRLNGNPGLGVSTNNWSRGWGAGGTRTNGTTALTGPRSATKIPASVPPGNIWLRQALIGAKTLGDAAPGEIIDVPVFVRVAAGARISGMQFRAVVTPSASSAPLDSTVHFIAALGGGLAPVSFSSNQVGCAWNLGSLSLSGQSSNIVGAVRFRVPFGASPDDCYRVQIVNADGAPDLSTQYDFETIAGCVFVGSPASDTGDPISDDWKIQFFGSVDSPLAAPDADPDGDGVPNIVEYLAGTDPTNASSCPRVNATGISTGGNRGGISLQLLTAPGKFYIIERSLSLIPPQWIPVATNLGDGFTAEIVPNNSPGDAGFYRVRVLP
jgi:hypothetical protein